MSNEAIPLFYRLDLYSIVELMKNNYFNEDEIQYFQDLLTRKRRDVMDEFEQFQKESLRQSAKSDQTGDLSDMPSHMADVGSDAFEQEIELGQAEKKRNQIGEIDAALERCQTGQYGICENGYHAISRERLQAIPWTRRCLKCKAVSESR